MKKMVKSSGKKKNPWIAHLQEYAKKHPEKSYIQCMSEAKKSYVPK